MTNFKQGEMLTQSAILRGADIWEFFIISDISAPVIAPKIEVVQEKIDPLWESQHFDGETFTLLGLQYKHHRNQTFYFIAEAKHDDYPKIPVMFQVWTPEIALIEYVTGLDIRNKHENFDLTELNVQVILEAAEGRLYKIKAVFKDNEAIDIETYREIKRTVAA